MQLARQMLSTKDFYRDSSCLFTREFLRVEGRAVYAFIINIVASTHADTAPFPKIKFKANTVL